MAKTAQSYSSLRTLRQCPRQYVYRYHDNLEKRTQQSSPAQLLGSAVHEGLAAALRQQFHKNPDDRDLRNAVAAGRSAVRRWKNVQVAALVFDEWTAQNAAMYEDAAAQAEVIIEYQLTKLPLNSWRVASQKDLFPVTGSAGMPIIEHAFEFAVENITLLGVIDAAFVDKHTGEIILVDWKTRGIFVPENIIQMDGQLVLYAAYVFSEGTHPLPPRVVQYQISSKVPQPPKLTPKTGKLSIAEQASTWAVWSAGVSAMGYNPEHYRQEMETRLRTELDFTRPAEVLVTPAMVQDFIRSVGATVTILQLPQLRNIAAYDMGICKFCPFKSLCDAERNGENTDVVRDLAYKVRSKPELTLEEEGE